MDVDVVAARIGKNLGHDSRVGGNAVRAGIVLPIEVDDDDDDDRVSGTLVNMCSHCGRDGPDAWPVEPSEAKPRDRTICVPLSYVSQELLGVFEQGHGPPSCRCLEWAIC